jgi:hypothetical protein
VGQEVPKGYVLAGRLSLPPAFLALYRNAELGDDASNLRGES